MKHSTLNSSKAFLQIVFLLAVLGILSGCGKNNSASVADENDENATDNGASVLVFSKTKGYYHESIPNGIAAIQKLGIENGFEVDTTKDAAKFTEDNLKKYKAIIFLSTTGDVLDSVQQTAMENYIKGGGGFVGVHAAADT